MFCRESTVSGDVRFMRIFTAVGFSGKERSKLNDSGTGIVSKHNHVLHIARMCVQYTGARVCV